MIFKGAGLKLVTSGKDTGAAALSLSGQSKGQCNLLVRSSSFCPMTSTILTFLRLGVSGIIIILLIREKNPPFYLASKRARKYLPLKLGCWSTRPVKDKVPKLPGHTPDSYYVTSPISLNVY